MSQHQHANAGPAKQGGENQSVFGISLLISITYHGLTTALLRLLFGATAHFLITARWNSCYGVCDHIAPHRGLHGVFLSRVSREGAGGLAQAAVLYKPLILNEI